MLHIYIYISIYIYIYIHTYVVCRRADRRVLVLEQPLAGALPLLDLTCGTNANSSNNHSTSNANSKTTSNSNEHINNNNNNSNNNSKSDTAAMEKRSVLRPMLRELLPSDKGCLYYCRPTKYFYSVAIRQRISLRLPSDKGCLYFFRPTNYFFTTAIQQRISLRLLSDKGCLYYCRPTKDFFMVMPSLHLHVMPIVILTTKNPGSNNPGTSWLPVYPEEFHTSQTRLCLGRTEPTPDSHSADLAYGLRSAQVRA